MFKKLLGIVLFILLISTFGYGKYDCELSNKLLYERGRIHNASEGLDIFNEKGVLRAVKNLKSYCYKEGWIDDDSYTVENYASSPFLFDHLIDVGFRKLDGNPKLSYVEVDSKGKEWFKKRKKLSTNIEGKKPGNIYKKFIKTWGTPNNARGKLYEKYINICTDIEKINSSLFGVKLNTEFVEEGNNNMNNCYRIVRNRFQREMQFINMIMLEQGSESIENSLKKLANKNISQNGLMRMLKKLTQFQGYFRVVVNKVQEGTKTCSY